MRDHWYVFDTKGNFIGDWWETVRDLYPSPQSRLEVFLALFLFVTLAAAVFTVWYLLSYLIRGGWNAFRHGNFVMAALFWLIPAVLVYWLVNQTIPLISAYAEHEAHKDYIKSGVTILSVEHLPGCQKDGGWYYPDVYSYEIQNNTDRRLPISPAHNSYLDDPCKEVEPRNSDWYPEGIFLNPGERLKVYIFSFSVDEFAIYDEGVTTFFSVPTPISMP